MMSIEKQKRIIMQMRDCKLTTVEGYTPFPKPFYHDLAKVKAIYLGCDSTNTKFKNRFEYVFALPNGDGYGFRQFVRSHRANLEQVGLSWETVYVQNLCQNYFTKETGANSDDWKKAAKNWIPILKKELSVFHPDIPVLLTAEVLYRVLLKNGVTPKRASEFYRSRHASEVMVTPEQNELGRPLIPFYRHRKYTLANADSNSDLHRYARLVRMLVR